MKRGKSCNHDTVSLLTILKNELEDNYTTNLQKFFRDWNSDSALATVLTALGIVEKIGGFWAWTAEEEPNEEMAELLRQTSVEYKLAS